MVANSNPTRNSTHRHAQASGRQCQAAVSAEDLTPDSELVSTIGAAPGPELQRAVMSAGQYVQHPYEGFIESTCKIRS